MTKEIAIGIIKELQSKPLKNRELTALDLAISALEQNEKAAEWYKTFVEKFESCEDAISRQAALDALGEDIMGGLNYRRIIGKELPSVQPSRNMRGDTDASN